jgi:hypothetical protein
MGTTISGATGIDKVQDSSITSAKIADGAITNTDINSSAAIAGSKISGGTGKVLQVITAIDSGSWSSSSTSFADTNLSVTITPSSTSNKILVLGAVSYSNSLASSNNGLRLVRGSTDLTGHQIYSLTIDGAGSYQRAVWSWHHLDSPSTTSAITYKVQAGHNTNGSSISLHAAKDSITVMEIAG